jgi:hypothetical protein
MAGSTQAGRAAPVIGLGAALPQQQAQVGGTMTGSA